MAQVAQEASYIQLTGIQPAGTVVYENFETGYKEVVLASDAEAGKQLIHCQDQQHPLYRIEYRNWRGQESSLAAYTLDDAQSLYTGF